MGTRKICLGILLWLTVSVCFAGAGLCIEAYTRDAGQKCSQADNLKLRQQVIKTFRAQVGVREKGNNTGPEIDQYLWAVGLDPGYAWCAALIGWGYTLHGIAIPRGAAWSPSWFPRSRIIPNEQAQLADVGGIYFASLGRIAHVMVYDEPWDNGSRFIYTIEGNTNDTGSRSGDGVYRKRRSKKQIHSSSNWIDP